MSDLETLQLVIFTVDGDRYALPIADVQEIIGYTTPRPIDAGGDVRGVISLRGKIIPVLDLAVRLGHPASGEQGEIIIVDGADQLVGVIVDDVDEVYTVARDTLQEMPHGSAGVLGSIVEIEGSLVAVIDLERLGAGSALPAVADVERLAA